MRALQKLIRNGNATGVSIPKPILIELEWLPGEMLVLELLEDRSIRVRRPCAQDFAPMAAPRMLPVTTANGSR